MIPYVLVSFADTVLILLVGVLLFGVPIRGSLLLLLGLTGLYLLPTLGYGLVISTIAQTQQQAQLMIMPVIMPAFMLSGFIFPVSSLPVVLQWVGYLLPTTYFIYMMRAVVIKGVGLSLILPQTIILGVFGVAMLGLAAWRFRKRLD
jgi:ABC-2 type transport system permease protein